VNWDIIKKNMFPGIFGAADPMAGMPRHGGMTAIDMGQPPSPSQDELDFNKEFMQSMAGNIGKPPKETNVNALSVGDNMKQFQVNPLQTTPEVGQYAPVPGFSLVKPLKRKHWYDYGGTA
jgi:hypothetical protein